MGVPAHPAIALSEVTTIRATSQRKRARRLVR
jgi:hypothetical protein